MVSLIRRVYDRLKGRIPLLYSALIIILVPLVVVINTVWNLNAFERDMHFAVREEAYTAQQMIVSFLDGQKITQELASDIVHNASAKTPHMTSVSVLVPLEGGKFTVLATTREDFVTTDESLLTNALAWSQNQSFFTEIYDPEISQNVWTLVAPLLDSEGSPQALLNLKMSTARVDQVVNRTVRDSIVIMVVSVVVVVLLLLNHIRFFKRASMYEQLKEINQMKDDFISVASHELRTPLTAIKGYISVVDRELRGKVDEQTLLNIDVINESVKRLDTLVEDLLNVSRLEQGKVDMTISAVDILPLINQVIAQLTPIATEKGLELSLVGSDEPELVIQGNPDRLNEVFMNVVGNAVKYTLTGSVQVATEVKKSTIAVTVKDTGVGIAPEDKARLFQKFSRIQNDATRQIPGTGLGLWITKELIERMGGSIHVDSIPERGTVFTLLFKKAKSEL